MQIRDLGPILVEQDGLSTDLGAGRLAAVLSPLANRVGELITSGALVDAVWGGHPPARAGQLLESLIWRLRKHLEPTRAARAEATVLRRDPHGYRLDLPAAAVDSGQLRETLPQVRTLVAAGDFELVLDRTAAALSLWRGEPYAGVTDTGWLEPVRQELSGARLDVAELRVQALLEVGRPEEAVDELGPLLADHPFRERLWAFRMTGLYRAGRQADALAAFTRAREVLADELGVDPGPELRDLHQRILDQDPRLDRRAVATVSTPSAGSRLPRRRSTLIGRDADLARLTALVAGHQLISLVGPGGAGKTRLAVEAGHHLGSSFPDGVWFVDLAATGHGDLLDVELAGALGLVDQPGRRPLEVVTGFLADRNALVVMDNCEHVLGACAAAVDEILDRCPRVRILATSREPLSLVGEQIVPVGPLPLGDNESADSPADSASAQLFLERSGNAVDLIAAAEDREAVQRICAAVGGLPLGIELAAAQTRTFTLAEIAGALERNPTNLVRHGAGPQRHASLRDTVDWGYRLARGDEQVLHRRLAVIPGPFTLDVAAALCGLPPLQADQALDLVGGLVHRSLLTSARPTGVDGLSTFGQLVPIRAHAAAVIDDEERAAVESARDRWLAGRIAEAPLDGRPGQAAFLRWLDDNVATLRATLESTVLRRADRVAIEIVGSLLGAWFERGRLAEAVHWVDGLRGVLDRMDAGPLDRALVDAMAGTVLALQHRRDEASTLLRECLPALSDPPPERMDAVTRALIAGAAAAWTGDIWDVAGEYVEAGLRFESADQSQLRIVLRAIQAANWAFTGNVVTGIEQANQVLRDNEVLGNDLAALFALVTLTVTALVGGDPGAALRTSDALLLTHRRMGTVAVGDTIETRASIRAAAGDDGAAIRCLGASAALSRRLGRDWPWHDFTPAVLADLRDRIDPSEFERHWSSGERLGLGDAERFTPEWI